MLTEYVEEYIRVGQLGEYGRKFKLIESSNICIDGKIVDEEHR